jgi:hypothetical protein
LNGADGGDGAPERRDAASRSIERDADLDTAGRDAEFVCHRLTMALDDLVERWLNLPDRFVVFGAPCTVAHFHLQGLLEIGQVPFVGRLFPVSHDQRVGLLTPARRASSAADRPALLRAALIAIGSWSADAPSIASPISLGTVQSRASSTMVSGMGWKNWHPYSASPPQMILALYRSSGFS